jgi:hypothetical protein
MTSGSIEEVSPPQGGPKPNSFQRIVGVLIAPNETFSSIARTPDWVVPLVLILVVSLISGIVIAQRVDFVSAVREQMAENKNISPDQMDRSVRMVSAFSKVAAYCAPIFSIIFLLIIAAAMLVAFRLFGGENNFKQSFSVSVYAWMPGLVKSIITLAIILSRDTVPAQDLAIIVRSNLGFLVDMKTNPMAFAVLTSLDVFTIWILILYTIGFSYASRLSKAKSAAIVVALWAVTVLFKLVPAAIKSLRG